MRPAAIVNNQVISVFDLESRINLALNSSNLDDSYEVRRRIAGPVLRNLIDETLQVQEAERQGIRVTGDEMNAAMRQIESNNGVDPGKLPAYLARVGIAASALESQVRAEILWAKYVNQRLRPFVDVGEDEVEAELSRIQGNHGRPEYLVSQISLFYDPQSSQADVVATAADLVDQIRAGGGFAAIAAQFSQGSMAREGGDLGWIQEGQSRPQFEERLRAMQVGDISDPVQTLDGVHILHLRDKRTTGSDAQNEVQLYLSQILLPGEPDELAEAAAQREDAAEAIAASLVGCEALNRQAEQLESSLSGDIGWVKISDLPPKFREAVQGLATGQASQPVTTDAGTHILMICERDDADADIDVRNTVYNRLASRRLAILEQRVIRDMRRAAFIDLRL